MSSVFLCNHPSPPHTFRAALHLRFFPETVCFGFGFVSLVGRLESREQMPRDAGAEVPARTNGKFDNERSGRLTLEASKGLRVWFFFFFFLRRSDAGTDGFKTSVFFLKIFFPKTFATLSRPEENPSFFDEPTPAARENQSGAFDAGPPSFSSTRPRFDGVRTRVENHRFTANTRKHYFRDYRFVYRFSMQRFNSHSPDELVFVFSPIYVL